MSKRMTSTTVYLTHVQAAKLKQLSQETHVSISDYIRQGIDIVLERTKVERRSDYENSVRLRWKRNLCGS
jgi:hypothetical protein